MAKSIYVCDIGNALGAWDADECKCYFLARDGDGKPEIAIAEAHGRATEVDDTQLASRALVQFVVLKKLFQSYQGGRRWLVELLRWCQAVDFLCAELYAGTKREEIEPTTPSKSKETWMVGRSRAGRNRISEAIYCQWQHGTVAVFYDNQNPPEAWYNWIEEDRWVCLQSGTASRLPEPIETQVPISREEGLAQLALWHEAAPVEKSTKRVFLTAAGGKSVVNKALAAEVIRRVMNGRCCTFAAALQKVQDSGDRRLNPPMIENAKELRQEHNRFLLEKKALEKKVVELDKRLEVALAESKQKDADRKALQEELVICRRQLTQSAGDFPSEAESLQECKVAGDKLIQFYGKIGCSEDQSTRFEFAQCIQDMLKQMLGLVENRYKELLEGMLRALGDHESLSSLSRSTQDGFDLYCKRYYVSLFALPKARLCILSDSGRNQETVSNSMRKDKLVLEGLCLIKEQICRDHPKIMNRDLGGPEGFGVIFAMLWRASVLLYMQRPQMQFDVTSEAVTHFSRDYHTSTNAPAKMGDDVVILIPAILKLSKPAEGKKPKGTKTPPDIILVEKAITDLA